MQILKPKLFVVFFVLLMTLAVSACTTAAPATVAPTLAPVIEYVEVTVVVPATPVPPTPTTAPPPPPDQSAFVAAWEGSPHGNTYGEGKGPNTWCSRCHSPQNWDPEAYIGPPPSCFSCKFPTDKECALQRAIPLFLKKNGLAFPARPVT